MSKIGNDLAMYSGSAMIVYHFTDLLVTGIVLLVLAISSDILGERGSINNVSTD